MQHNFKLYGSSICLQQFKNLSVFNRLYILFSELYFIFDYKIYESWID